MSLDLTQIGSMVKWLDEERLKDRTLIAVLQERLESQAQQLSRQEEQITALQRTVASMEALLGRVAEFTQALEQLKVELGHMLDQRDEHHRKEQREAERARQLETGALKDEITRLTDETRRVARLEEGAASLQAEQRRLNEVLQRVEQTAADLGKRVEERVQAVVYLEEQRRADNRRIAALEAETTDLRRRAEAADGKILLLEETVQKQRARLEEEGLKPIREFGKVVEELRVADFRRTQEVKKWAGQADEVRQEMERLRQERQRSLEQHQQAKRALEALEAFQARLETRQNEVAQMQRLAEERIKRQWEEWQAAQEKERRRWELATEERWKSQERTNKGNIGRLEKLELRAAAHHEQILALWESLSTQAHSMVAVLQDVLEAAQEKSQAAKGA